MLSGVGIPLAVNTAELWVALTAQEARALAAAADVTGAVVNTSRGKPAGPPLETAADKLRLALIEIGEAPV